MYQFTSELVVLGNESQRVLGLLKHDALRPHIGGTLGSPHLQDATVIVRLADLLAQL